MSEEVTVTISGPTGCGKSFIYTEIYLALKAIGVPIKHADEKVWRRDIRTSGTETDRDLYKPTVTLAERNIPRKAKAKMTGEGE